MMATVLCHAEGRLELSREKKQFNDNERLEALHAINRYRSNVQPEAADMIAIVSQSQVPAVGNFLRFISYRQ